jgi:DnaJ-domain-containing protein 1
MNLRDGIGILKKAGQAAADVAMTQPGIRRRVERVQATVEVIRREVETIAAQAEARAQVLLRELQEEALRARKQIDRQRSASDHYRTLGLQNGASLDDVKKAYRKMMRQHHPDKHSTDAAAEARAHDRAQAINEAYRELTALLTGRENRAAH